MIRVLLIHNSSLTTPEYKKQFYNKYEEFRRHKDVWDITAIKLGTKLKDRNYDKIYFDSDNINIKELSDYILKSKVRVDIFPVTFLKVREKLKTYTPSITVKNLWKARRCLI